DIPDLTDGNHHTFLGRFAEVGLVGLIPYLMIFYHMFRVGLRVYGKSEGFERGFVLVFLSVLISYIIEGNFGDHRNNPFFNTVLFLLFGTVAGIEVHMASPPLLRRYGPSLPLYHAAGYRGGWHSRPPRWSALSHKRARMPSKHYVAS